jgi:nicotinamidase-related amidase
MLAAAAACSLTAPAEPPPQTLRGLYGLRPPVRLRAARTAVVLVDFQEEFFHGGLPLRNADQAAAHAARLAGWARAAGILVVHVQNVSARPGSPLFAAGAPNTAIVPALAPAPGDEVLTKSMAGAFSRTDLDDRLRARSIDTVIVAGLMTHLAVFITASDATLLGYHTLVVGDATATRALPGAGGGSPLDEAFVQRAALAALADRAADVLDTAAVVGLEVSP